MPGKNTVKESPSELGKALVTVVICEFVSKL